MFLYPRPLVAAGNFWLSLSASSTEVVDLGYKGESQPGYEGALLLNKYRQIWDSARRICIHLSDSSPDLVGIRMTWPFLAFALERFKNVIVLQHPFAFASPISPSSEGAALLNFRTRLSS